MTSQHTAASAPNESSFFWLAFMMTFTTLVVAIMFVLDVPAQTDSEAERNVQRVLSAWSHSIKTTESLRGSDVSNVCSIDSPPLQYFTLHCKASSSERDFTLTAVGYGEMAGHVWQLDSPKNIVRKISAPEPTLTR